MKKSSVLLSAALMMLSSFSIQAQETRRLIEPERAEFNPHWSLQLQAGAGYTIGEANKTKDLISPAAAINAGYSFSPAFTLRFGASGWQGRGAWVSPYATYKYNYIQGNVDAVLSLTNLICGFNPGRTLDLYGFLGVGLNGAFNNDEAVALANAGAGFEKLWHGHRLSVAPRAGLGLNVWVSPRVAINVEANANMLSDHFNSKRGSSFDWQYNGLVGVTIRLGSNTRVIPAVYEDIPAPAPAPAPAPEPAPVVTPEPAPVEVKKAQPMKIDVFFVINSSRVRGEEMAKVDELVSYMKANPAAKVAVTGYADKGTGTAAYNMKISRMRAESVADALRAAGISADRISVDAKGDTEQPFDVNNRNRVAIAIAGE